MEISTSAATRRRTALINQLRAILLERGMVAPQGRRDVRFLGPRGLKKVPVRHQLGGAMAAMSHTLPAQSVELPHPARLQPGQPLALGVRLRFEILSHRSSPRRG